MAGNMPIWEMTEDIVVSGISGRFPESDNIDELAKNLFDNTDMITEDERRWPLGLYGLPTRAGKIKDLSKFDAQFFGVHGKQANLMDPQARLLLELTYEALCDAGINPQQWRGSRTGVYVGACVSEVEEGLAQDVSKVSGYALTGCSRSMFANRISYTFDFQGPSYAMDTACSSSFLAFQQAILGLRSGQCDQAIVGGVNICLRPVTALQFHKLGLLAHDGKCKHMDASADGYVRSEACSVVLLQRKSEAKRIYATVIHSKTNTDGYKKEGITYPSSEAQRDLMKDVCAEAGVNPLDVSYIEAHGTGTKVGDPNEIRAIADVYCTGRNGQLQVGSVKSNLGHSEPASGLCSLAKVLIAFENKNIPANLHVNTHNPNIEPLTKGLIKPITENTPYNGGLAAINSFGFGGVNVHAIIKSNDKDFGPDSFKVVEKIPRLIAVCGRVEPAVNHVLDFVEQNPAKVSREFLAILNDVAKIPASSGMNYRGYMLMKEKTEETTTFDREVTRVPEKRPLWFVFSGMGSQWPAMAKSMMNIEIFAKSIHFCADILRPLGIDLLHLLLEGTEKDLDTIIAPFVTIAAVQIGLVDVLRACAIEPDGIVGHSVGELGCAYADKCFDARQMILSAYWRGKSVADHATERGLMAAVGMSWEETQKRCPPGVIPACHNSEDSVTISGAYDATKKMVADLKAENIFAREVKSCDIAFHSPYIGPIGPELKENLKPVLHTPVLRSEKWISSSVPEERWNDDSCRYSAPDYYVNNLVSPVLFHSACKHLPKNAIVIEIAPHTLLQAILKRSLGADMTYVGLMKRGNDAHNVEMLLGGLGKLYNLGLNPQIENLYPKVDYPVPRGTQSVGSLIQWDHSQNWLVTQYPEYFNPSSSSDYVVKVDVAETEDEYLTGHKIDGRVLYPATGYLMLAWKMLAKIKGQFHDKIPVEFENVTIHRATLLPKTGQTKFVIRMMETSGEFSISEGGAIVATGKVFVPEDPVLKMSHIVDENLAKPSEPHVVTLNSKDIYKELRVRGYDYGETFQGLLESTDDGRVGKVKWTGNWISFADACLQMTILGKQTRALFLPVRFQSVRCDPRVLLKTVEDTKELPVVVDSRINICVTTGLEIRGLKANIAPRRQGVQQPTLEKYQFIANSEDSALTVTDKSEVEEYLQVCSTVAKKVLQASGKSTSGIMNGFKDAKEELIRRYLDAAPTDYALLHTLKNMADNTASSKLEDKIIKAVQKHRRDLPQDLLANVFTRERLLRPSLDLVAENVGDRVNVLEIGSSPAVMHATVQSFLELAGATVAYTLAHATPNALSSAVTSSGIDLVEFGADKPKLPSGADLVVYKDSNDDLKFVAESVTGATKDNGFALAFFRNELSVPEDLIYGKGSTTSKRLDEFVKLLQKSGYSLLSKRGDSKGSTVVLLRKLSTASPSTPVIVPITSSNYKWVVDLKTKLKTENQNIWLVAQEAATNGIVGFVNCLRKEPGGNKIRCLFDATGNMPAVNFKQAPYNEILKNDLVMNVYENKTLGTYRHLSMNNVEEDGLTETEHAYLNVTTRGDLSSLKWFESQHKYFTALQKTQKTSESLCHVYYAPLNFRDVMLATGKLPPDALPGNMALQDCILGLEFAGRDSTGKRVMGMIPAKGLATTVVVDDPDFIWPIPDKWSMEEASTVPVVYATAYYSLIVRGGLQPGESVLIHSGSGGVGQAAISICLNLGCEVFTSVGNNDKREYLKKTFPQLKDRNIANSRNTSFEQQVLRETKGRGVDIVLNSLSDEKLHASIRCLAQHGRFLEIGKYDLSQNNPIGMSVFLKNIAFHGILLDSLFVTGPNAPPAVIAQKQMVAQLIKEGIKTGAVRPLQRSVFPSDGAEEAFRFMASGNHIGKVILKVRDEEPKAVVVPTPIKIKAIARTVFHPQKTYILNGGLGGFGLELSYWMVDRGARKLILTSRSGPKEAYQQMSLKRLKSLGAVVQVSKANASTADGAKKLLEEAKALGPIGGIFNLAMVLHDGVFENQTVENFNKVCEPKLDSTIHLDKLTRQNISDLEYFVAFSSVSCSRGNAGQTNYGFANSAMERICERRRRDGFHGVAIQWGAIGDVGVILEKLGGNDSVVGGTSPQRIPSCMSVLDRFLQTPYPVCSSIVRSERKTQTSSSKSQTLVDVVSHILGVKNPSALHPSMTLAELGLDSLMGVEVKQALERDYDVILSMAEIRALNVHQLKEISKGNSAAVKETGNSASMQLSLSAPVLTAPTEATVKLNDVEEGKPVFFVPPLEGAFALVEPLAKALKRPAVGLNWTVNMNSMKTVEEVANHYISLIRTLQSGDAIDLVGYSFGAVVAFDISLKTKVENLVLLDGSPTQMKAYIEQFREKLQVNDPSEQHAEILVTFLSQLVPIDSTKARAELKNASDEESRNYKAAEMYFDNGGPKCDADDISFAAQAFATKIKMMYTYNSTKKSEGNVLLLRAEDVIVKNDTPVPQDYGLSEVISGECTVRSMKGNHKTFLIQNLKAIQSAVNERL